MSSSALHRAHGFRKLCQGCHERKARFQYRGVVRAHRDHNLCFECYRSERDPSQRSEALTRKAARELYDPRRRMNEVQHAEAGQYGTFQPDLPGRNLDYDYDAYDASRCFRRLCLRVCQTTCRACVSAGGHSNCMDRVLFCTYYTGPDPICIVRGRRKGELRTDSGIRVVNSVLHQEFGHTFELSILTSTQQNSP